MAAVVVASAMAVLGVFGLFIYHSYKRNRDLKRWRREQGASIQRQLDLAAGREPRRPETDIAYAAALTDAVARMAAPYDQFALSPMGEESLALVLAEERESRTA